MLESIDRNRTPVPAIARAPRILVLPTGPAGADPAWFAQAAALGFDHVLAPLSADGEEDLGAIAAIAARHGLVLLLDVAADQAMPTGMPDAYSGLDPRRMGPRSASGCMPELAMDVEAGQAMAVRWNQLTQAHPGVAGLRLSGLDRIAGPALPALVRTLRHSNPDWLLVGCAAGMPRERLDILRGLGLDFVCGSLPWWDRQAGWFWDEWAALEKVAPVLAESILPGRRADAAMPAGLAAWRHDLWLAAWLGAGWAMPAGAEFGGMGGNVCFADARRQAGFDLGPGIAAINQHIARAPGRLRGGVRPLRGAGPVLAIMRTEGPDPRVADRAELFVTNSDPIRAHAIDPACFLTDTGMPFGPFAAAFPGGGEALEPGRTLSLAPGEARSYVGAAGVASPSRPLATEDARRAAQGARIGIEQVMPIVDGGRFPVKRLAGETVSVEADVICDGHDKLGVALLWRGPDDADWHEVRMRPLGNDRWQGSFALQRLGSHRFTIQAWRDAFATYRDELDKKWRAGVPIALELREGLAIVAEAARRHAPVAPLLAALHAAGPDAQRDLLLSPDTAVLMEAADDRPFGVKVDPAPVVEAERTGAAFAAWYEVFPRSMSDDASRHGTLRDVIRHLPRIRDMGFDVLYFPPIHPIGRSNRKGRNNSLQAGPDDPGSPYAIGSEMGGHDALHPELGTLEDFEALRRAAIEHGLELALDFAVQCSPDHPWLKQHPDWFAHRPDGSIRYAENPPKKYEDIVNVDFYASGAVPELWLALCRAVLFWVERGIRLFRVDNPHTKPFPFWQWLIAEVRARHPETVFLAEAFTRPKVMYRLAKIGFSQSYTYFTWRNEKRELEEYLTELATAAPAAFFRPHFFVNTPDINPAFLHHSGRPGFLIRAALAATLSGLWGVYNGFELCEGAPVKPGKEEYLDSEKYEIRAWDWDRPGNIVPEITRLNAIRRANPALHDHRTVRFLPAANDRVLWFEKATADRSNVVLVAISLDPHAAQETEFELPLWRWGLSNDATLQVEDLVCNRRFAFQGKIQSIRLTPDRPYAIWLSWS